MTVHGFVVKLLTTRVKRIKVNGHTVIPSSNFDGKAHEKIFCSGFAGAVDLVRRRT
jgi:hypothetical protein